MIDRDLVIRKLVLIGTDLEALRARARKPIEEYLRSDYDELAAERLLERLIGRMIDVNYHLIVESGEVPPRDYHASFVTLGKLSILPVEFAGLPFRRRRTQESHRSPVRRDRPREDS